MVSGSTMDEGGPLIVSAKVRKTIQSIKEIVGDHSDADIYMTLKETNMDPNETAQKLLNQDPFRVVKRRRDRKKEPQNAGYKGLADPQRHYENVGQGKNLQAPPSDHNVRRKNNSQNTLPGISRGFRAVRDNRGNHITYKEVKHPSFQHTSDNEQPMLNSSEKGLPAVSGNHRRYSGNSSSQPSNGPYERARRSEAASNGMDRISSGKEKQGVTSNFTRRVKPNKPNNVHPNSSTLATSSAVGAYSSSTDPVHVPSPNSRSPAAVGALKRDVGAVGVRRKSSENSVKQSSNPSSIANSLKRKDSNISKSEQANQTNVTKTLPNGISVGRPSSNNHFNSRPHQQPEGHRRVSEPSKEWKPKSNQKSRSNPGVIGIPKKPDAEVKSDAEKLQDKLSQLSILDNQNVIIAQHIRVPESDRSQLTFGTIGAELDSSRHQTIFQSAGTTEMSNKESPASLSVPALESSDDVSGGKQVDLQEDLIRASGLVSPASGSASEQQLPDHRESLSPQNLDNYVDVGLVQDNNSSELHQQQQVQDSRDIPGFSAYDPPTGYDISYFRPAMDETVQSQSQPSSQEGLNAYATNSITASTIPMVRQPPHVAQMYPQQVHVSHFANVMPYRQYLSPVYVPPMAVPGYSSSPPYPHPSNGNSNLMMPGGGSHFSANSLKYGLQQFKHIPSGSPTGFGNFTGSAGYPNTPGVIGGATMEDSSRIKYKDNNLYVPNPQAEPSEMWIQNPRELHSMQSTPYYNIPGQTAHASYIPSHSCHAAPFNSAVAQSSNMQYPGMYHHHHHAPPQPAAAMTSPHHHLGAAMANNLGVGVAAAAPGAQVGAYQQPQLGHLNWTGNL